jgi:hypothetical protein
LLEAGRALNKGATPVDAAFDDEQRAAVWRKRNSGTSNPKFQSARILVLFNSGKCGGALASPKQFYSQLLSQS